MWEHLPDIYRLPSTRRWTVTISIDPWSASHELGQLLTDVDEIAQHLAIAWETTLGTPRGRAQNPEEDASRRQNALALRAALKPLAADICRRLDHDVNRWLRTLLELEPLHQATDDQVWEILEKWPVERSLELFGAPAVQDAIGRFRKSKSADTRRRLRRIFRRLATAPGAPGAPRKKEAKLTAAEAAFCETVQSDVRTLRKRWKGNLDDASALKDAFALVARTIPIAPAKSQQHEARRLLHATHRPDRVAETLIQAAHPHFTRTAIRRSFLSARGSNRTK